MRRDRIFIRKQSSAGPSCTSTRGNSTKRSRLSGRCSRRRAIGADAPMPSHGFNGSAFTRPTRLLCAIAGQKASRMSCGKKAMFIKRRKRAARRAEITRLLIGRTSSVCTKARIDSYSNSCQWRATSTTSSPVHCALFRSAFRSRYWFWRIQLHQAVRSALGTAD